MFCPKCGNRFDEGECNFCPKCGAAVPDEYKGNSGDNNYIDQSPSDYSEVETDTSPIVLPNTKDYLSYKVKKKGCGYYLGLCLAFCFSVWVIGSIVNYSYSKPESTSSQQTYTSVPITQLRDEASDNAASAKEKWNGEYIVTTGIVSDIDNDANYFYLDTGAIIELFRVRCSVDDESLKQIIRSISKGDSLTVYGKVTNVGSYGDYTIKVTKIVTE